MTGIIRARAPIAIAAIGLGMTLAIDSASAGSAYWRITGDHVTVIANGSANQCTRLAKQIGGFERALRQLAGWDDSVELPPLTLYSITQRDADRVLFTSAERHQQSVRNWNIFSKFLPGQQDNMAVLIDSPQTTDEPLQSIYLLYAQDLLTRGPSRQNPPWYLLGVAYLTNGLIVHDDGSVIFNRSLPFLPVSDSYHHSQDFDLPKLLQTRAQDLRPDTDFTSLVRVARDWAQYGLLTTPEHEMKYRQLAEAMRQGAPADEAVKQTFMIPLQQLDKEFRDGHWRSAANYRWPAVRTTAPLPAAVELSGADTEAALKLLAERVQQTPMR